MKKLFDKKGYQFYYCGICEHDWVVIGINWKIPKKKNCPVCENPTIPYQLHSNNILPLEILLKIRERKRG